jgi:hypothetical protein
MHQTQQFITSHARHAILTSKCMSAACYLLDGCHALRFPSIILYIVTTSTQNAAAPRDQSLRVRRVAALLGVSYIQWSLYSVAAMVLCLFLRGERLYMHKATVCVQSQLSFSTWWLESDTQRSGYCVTAMILCWVPQGERL